MYAVRYWLHFSIDEWNRLPGWQQQVYLDQLNEHKPWEAEQRPEGSGRGGDGRPDLADADAELMDLAAFKIKVRKRPPKRED